MLRNALLDAFKNSTISKYEKEAERILQNDLVSEIDTQKSEDKIEIIASVISEDLYNQYSCKIDIDKKTKEVLFTHCTCDNFEVKGYNKTNYCCKHIQAAFYRFLNLLDEDVSLKDILGFNEEKNDILKLTEANILNLLINKDTRQDEITFEIIFNKDKWTQSLNAEFKVGYLKPKSKFYIIKDINAFLLALENKVSLPIGKEFTLDIKKQYFSSKARRLLKFITMLKKIDYSSSYRKINERLIFGKVCRIPEYLLRDFMLLCKDFKTYLGDGFYSRIIETEIINDKMPFPLNLKETQDMIKLEVAENVPEKFCQSDDVYLSNMVIYIPPEEQAEKIIPYIEAFGYRNSIFFTKNEENKILKELIPSMQKVSDSINLSPSIKNKVVLEKVKFKMYFDKEDEISLTLKVCYGSYEFNIFDDYIEKVIYRDLEKEYKMVTILEKYGFKRVMDKFILFKDEEAIFDFFKYDIVNLQKYGEVYYSESFTGIKHLTTKHFDVHVEKGKFDYFEFNVKISDISDAELKSILRAFRDNKKYYRLQDGSFLDLEEIELNKLLKLTSSIDNEKEDKLYFNNNRASFIEDYIAKNKLSYIKGRKEIKEIKKSLESKTKQDVNIEGLTVNLRNYQKEGFLWLKKLKSLNCGGILGDEMGLGKTLQAISLLASESNIHSLIIVPTSLVYNWKEEINKFAPSIKVALVVNNKEEREDLLKNYKEFDVIITTYNLIRRDIELYYDLEFDYCIIDEAQNIKNASSQGAKAVKKINAKHRFALTGTPIENSLMELWSIFDFIMPGYLFDEKKFATRYHRRLEEDDCIIDEIAKLINPFILRRYKKDVIKELPDKIEKKLIIPMTEKQSTVYNSYAKYVKDLVESKVKDDEFKNSKLEILSYITKLRQIALDPSVVMKEYEGKSGKIEYLKELILECIAEGHKILLFSQFTSILKNISQEFDSLNISYYYLDGSTKVKDRNDLVHKFNNDKTSVFLISLKAGGTGLNLTSADIVIHFDPWWNPAVENQATDRAHRIGQKNIVEVIKLISEGTVEDKILKLQDAKKELITKIIGDNVDFDRKISSISEEDIVSYIL